jgi:magnesium transporter
MQRILIFLRYDEDTAGGLMGRACESQWKLECAYLRKEMRAQAENVSRVHSIYVVDDETG